MTVLLAGAAALLYGLSDFVGGLASRRTSVWPIGLLACVGGAVGALVLLPFDPGSPTWAHVGWAALAGLGSGSGTAFLYRGFALGRMGVVAPVSAVGAVLLPVVVGLLGGERPAVLAWIGIVLALPGIWLVAREDGDQAPAAPGGLTDGLLAGLGFGVLFAALGQVPDSAGFTPLVVAQSTAVLAVAVLAAALGQDARPRTRAHAWGLLPGFLATAAVLLFLLATQQGLLSIAAVITSLYPAFTVLLAILVLREHVHRPQLVGLVLCATAVVCVSAA